MSAYLTRRLLLILPMFGDALRDLLDPRLRGDECSYGTAKMKRKRGFLARLINPFS